MKYLPAHGIINVAGLARQALGLTLSAACVPQMCYANALREGVIDSFKKHQPQIKYKVNKLKKNIKYIAEACDDGKTVLNIIKNKLNVSSKLLASLKKDDIGIMLNGVHITVRERIFQYDTLELNINESDDQCSTIVPSDIPIDIVYEDDDLIAVNKPPFMPTHPSHGHFEDTLANAVHYYLTNNTFADTAQGFVFRAVNRLDRNTSGLVCIAKNKYSASKMCSYMNEGRIHKGYIAVVDGSIANSNGIIDTYIRRQEESIITRVVCNENQSKAQRAITEYKVLKRAYDDSHTLVMLCPKTGRTHQLRVHMAHIGNPITGDGLYGKENELIKRHLLHAALLEFPLPTFSDNSQIIKLEAALPADMEDFIYKYFRSL